ncbi:hypothetical protein [Leptospira noguchii]|nr:hypothetical protein [Leptospira noguchii]
MKRFLRKRLKLNTTLTTDRVNSASRFSSYVSCVKPFRNFIT